MGRIRQKTAPVEVLACEVCGRLPHPRRTRLAFAKLAAVFPVELMLHAAVMHTDLPYPLALSVLTVTTTVLVIWIVEPSAMRLFGSWMHGPDLRRRAAVDDAGLLWRIRVRVSDTPGQLQELTKHLARRQVNILAVHVHRLDADVLDELVVSARAARTIDELTTAAADAGGYGIRVWQATALTLVDGQTKALTMAARVAADPGELPLAVAELLGAHYVNHTAATDPGDGTVLELASPTGRTLRFHRPDEPFTPAEIARAHRLHDLARTTTATREF
ncbi:amino acid-binding protein [Nocardia jiangxiensis]|uniref:amino acid-binding protein n=1 Tax=Nocardia jiangxiensis TaxID=282685 RepID=UPI00031C1849|nr:amino acid-binding protein [Nocardia jiangxiensis]